MKCMRYYAGSGKVAYINVRALCCISACRNRENYYPVEVLR